MSKVIQTTVPGTGTEVSVSVTPHVVSVSYKIPFGQQLTAMDKEVIAKTIFDGTNAILDLKKQEHDELMEKLGKKNT